MKKYKLKTNITAGQIIMDRVFNYVLPAGTILEESGYSYIAGSNIWFDKHSVENSPETFELINE